eukprot:NODE_1445_length_1160_cov_93.888389_g1188_i0.p1 GENE.NODE_1445_length_1160_cov_93.888389_g1188_i0~~NODE_1445_length_1160_cov_93.888389_g1188_i0.p1  ORF type:complete len:355 (+),score=67.51 NODE_1445_length_1160_cov_93.888389_g1188_i0:38-1102(+)
METEERGHHENDEMLTRGTLTDTAVESLQRLTEFLAALSPSTAALMALESRSRTLTISEYAAGVSALASWLASAPEPSPQRRLERVVRLSAEAATLALTCAAEVVRTDEREERTWIAEQQTSARAEVEAEGRGQSLLAASRASVRQRRDMEELQSMEEAESRHRRVALRQQDTEWQRAVCAIRRGVRRAALQTMPVAAELVATSEACSRKAVESGEHLGRTELLRHELAMVLSNLPHLRHHWLYRRHQECEELCYREKRTRAVICRESSEQLAAAKHQAERATLGMAEGGSRLSVEEHQTNARLDLQTLRMMHTVDLGRRAMVAESELELRHEVLVDELAQRNKLKQYVPLIVV